MTGLRPQALLRDQRDCRVWRRVEITLLSIFTCYHTSGEGKWSFFLRLPQPKGLIRSRQRQGVVFIDHIDDIWCLLLTWLAKYSSNLDLAGFVGLIASEMEEGCVVLLSLGYDRVCRMCGLISFCRTKSNCFYFFYSQLLLVSKSLACNSSCLLLETIAYLFLQTFYSRTYMYSMTMLTAVVSLQRPFDGGLVWDIGRFMVCNLGPKGTSSWPVRWWGRLSSKNWGNFGSNFDPKRWGKVYWWCLFDIFFNIF